MDDIRQSIDWTKHYEFDRSIITCSCGQVYRSHFKMINYEGILKGIVETACPTCGHYIDNAIRVTSEPETWEIGDL